MIFKLLAAALSFELGSLSFLFFENNSFALVSAYLLAHSIGSVLLAFGLALLVPNNYRTPRRWLCMYLFAFSFFMPILGLVSLMAAFVISAVWPRKLGHTLFDTAIPVRFTTHRNHEGTGFRGGQVRAQLANSKAPLDQRMKALVAVQDTPARATGSLLRTLLADSSDDIRLLAYGILDSKEKLITQRILVRRHKLVDIVDTPEFSVVNKQIAELYWELIYQDLVQGDMRTFSGEQVRKYGYEALKGLPDDAGLWFLLARLELFSGNIDAAESALLAAQQRGFVRERLLPYITELRFLQRRFSEVSSLFAQLDGTAGVPALAQSRQFWLDGQSGVAPSLQAASAVSTHNG